MAVRGNTKFTEITVDEFKRIFGGKGGFTEGGTGATFRVDVDESSMRNATQSAKKFSDHLKQAKSSINDISADYYNLSQEQQKSYQSIRDSIDASREYSKNLSEILYKTIGQSKQTEEQKISAVDFITKMKNGLAGQADVQSRLYELERLRLDYATQVANGTLGQNTAMERLLDSEIKLAQIETERRNLQSGLLDDLKSQLGLVGTIGETFAKYGMYAAIAVSAGLLAKELSKAAISAFELFKNSGASLKQSAQYASNIAAAQLSMTGLLYGSDAVVQSADALVKEFGDVSAATDEAVKSVTRLAAMTGDAASAVQLNKVFMALSDGTQQGADNMADMVKHTAQLNNVLPERIMRDLAQYSFEFQKNGVKSAEQMAKTLITINKMGASFEGILKTRDALFDVEGSLERQMKAQAFTGRQLNIIEAQRLAVAGETEKLAELMVSDLGDLNTFQNYNLFQQDAIAEAYGQTREEVLKILTEQQRRNGNDEDAIINVKTMQAALVGVLGTTTSVGGKALDVAGKFNMAGINILGMGKNILKSVIPAMTKMLGLQKLSAALSSKMSKLGGVTGSASGAAAGSSVGRGIGGALKGISGGLKAFASPQVAAGLALVTAGIIGIGFAMKLAAPGFKTLGEAIGIIVVSLGEMISTVVKGFGEFITNVSKIASVDMAKGMLATAGGFYALAGSLAAFSVAGIAAIPAMTAVGTFTSAMAAISSLNGANINEGNSLVEEIRALREDIRNQPILIKVDDKVVSEITRVQNRQTSYKRQMS